MALTSATLIKCPDYDPSRIAKAIEKQFANSAVLGKSIKPGDKVLVKPNLIAPKSKSCATQTDPAVIYETVKFLKDFGAKPFVADSPAWSDTKNCIKKLKLAEPLKKLGVEVKQLNKPTKISLPNTAIKVNISSVAIDICGQKHVRLCQRQTKSILALRQRQRSARLLLAADRDL